MSSPILSGLSTDHARAIGFRRVLYAAQHCQLVLLEQRGRLGGDHLAGHIARRLAILAGPPRRSVADGEERSGFSRTAMVRQI